MSFGGLGANFIFSEDRSHSEKRGQSMKQTAKAMTTTTTTKRVVFVVAFFQGTPTRARTSTVIPKRLTWKFDLTLKLSPVVKLTIYLSKHFATPLKLSYLKMPDVATGRME